MKMTERYADTLQAREIITDFLKWAKHKPLTEATLDEYFGIDRAALEAEAKDAEETENEAHEPSHQWTRLVPRTLDGVVQCPN